MGKGMRVGGWVSKDAAVYMSRDGGSGWVGGNVASLPSNDFGPCTALCASLRLPAAVCMCT